MFLEILQISKENICIEVRMREDTDQENSVSEHFLHSVLYYNLQFCLLILPSLLILLKTPALEPRFKKAADLQSLTLSRKEIPARLYFGISDKTFLKNPLDGFCINTFYRFKNDVRHRIFSA